MSLPHFVFSVLAKFPASQSVQVEAPSELMLFPSHTEQLFISLFLYVPASHGSDGDKGDTLHNEANI